MSSFDSSIKGLLNEPKTEWLAVSEAYSTAWDTGDRHHIIERDSLELKRPFWTTRCGWHFGEAKGVRILPDGLREIATKPCSKCFRVSSRNA